MKEWRALLRKQFLETRWVLGILTLSFFALAILTVWLTFRFERLIERGEVGPAIRRYGFLRALGGSNMDYSTTALLICWWNHPVIVLSVLGWSIMRGTSGVAGEIERGTLDLTLSRPVSRSTYLLSQVVFAALGLLLLSTALIVGIETGARFYALKNLPSVATLLRPAAMLMSLGLAVFGYTLPVAAWDVVRWRPGLASAGATLVGLIAMSVATQFEGYEWYLERLSVFRAYAPVTVSIKGEPLGYNVAVLVSLFAAGVALGLLIFARRDLPTNS